MPESAADFEPVQTPAPKRRAGKLLWLFVAALVVVCAGVGLWKYLRRDVGPTVLDGFAAVKLDNGLVKMTVYLPDAASGYYRAQRFDWAGIIGSLQYKGHTFVGKLKPMHDPENHEDAIGPVEEFGQQKPTGFSKNDTHGTFIKIGVGRLRQGGEGGYYSAMKFDFAEPPQWKTTYGPDWIEFQQNLPDTGDGWSYVYTKRIELLKGQPAFVLEHRLKNTGKNTIDVDVYCHNMIQIDGTPANPDYVLNLPFACKAATQPSAEIPPFTQSGHEIRLTRELHGFGGFALDLSGYSADPKDNGASIINEKTGAGITLQGDRPLTTYNVWMTQRAICPEPFVEIHVEPGAETTWKTMYTMSVGK